MKFESLLTLAKANTISEEQNFILKSISFYKDCPFLKFFLSTTDSFRKEMTLIIATLAYNLCALCLLQNYVKQSFTTFDNFLYNNTSGRFKLDHVIKSIQKRT